MASRKHSESESRYGKVAREETNFLCSLPGRFNAKQSMWKRGKRFGSGGCWQA